MVVAIWKDWLKFNLQVDPFHHTIFPAIGMSGYSLWEWKAPHYPHYHSFSLLFLICIESLFFLFVMRRFSVLNSSLPPRQISMAVEALQGCNPTQNNLVISLQWFGLTFPTRLTNKPCMGQLQSNWCINFLILCWPSRCSGMIRHGCSSSIIPKTTMLRTICKIPIKWGKSLHGLFRDALLKPV